MKQSLEQLQNFVEWQIERGFCAPFIAELNTLPSRRPTVAFVASALSLQRAETSTMLHKIIAAMKLGEANIKVVSEAEWLNEGSEKIDHAVNFGTNGLNLPTSKVTLLPSLEDMLNEPQLKIGAWQQLQSLSLSLR